MYKKPPLFTVIVHTYNRPEFLSETAKAILNQTYDNLEIIFIDNGATEKTKEYLYEYQSKDKRVKLLHFEENQFRWYDPLRYIDVCFNSALEMSTGNYIWHQDDDDIIAEDYIEKMVDLFQGHPDCISAAGLPVNMDIERNIWTSDIYERKSNYRSRYMSGHILALEYIRNLRRGTPLFSAPGQIFSFRRDALKKYGRFHKAYETHHLYGIVPFGVTGFDETAYFYWRRHVGQLNTSLSSKGWIGTRELSSMINDLNIENKWKIFGNDTAKYVVRSIKREQATLAAYWFSRNLVTRNLTGSIKILKDTWKQGKFWIHIPNELYKNFIKFFHPRNIYKKLFT